MGASLVGRCTAAVAVIGSLLLCGRAWGATASPIEASGQVTGEVKRGSPIVVTVTASHPGGWQKVDSVKVALALRGRPLDEVIIDPTRVSLQIPGSAGPFLLGEAHRLAGAYFVVDGSKVTISARGNRLTLQLPLTLAAEPPPGARLTYRVNGVDVSTTGERFLTGPVAADRGGLSWGTLGAAIAGALLAGTVLGNLFASNRRKPVRPSVYAAVQRRIEQERGAK